MLLKVMLNITKPLKFLDNNELRNRNIIIHTLDNNELRNRNIIIHPWQTSNLKINVKSEKEAMLRLFTNNKSRKTAQGV